MIGNSPHSELPVVRFGDVVRNVTETCRDPEAEGLERYLGLEHLDGGELAIRRWGDLATDEVSFTRRFRKGHVLFAKRRAYQRKLAVAEFDGICSSDILCFEPKDPNVLLPELLPFICQTDAFFDHALGTSAGSLSPRTRWSQLKTFEFPLPLLDEQKRIAEILWAADEAAQRFQPTILAAGRLWKKLLLSFFESRGPRWETKEVREIGDVQLGRQRSPKYTTGKCPKPYLRVVNVLDGKLDLRDVEEMDFGDRDYQRYSLRAGDILVTEGDITSPYNVGRSAVYRGEIDGCCFQNTLIRVRVCSDVIAEFVHAALRFCFYKGIFAGVANTTTVTHLGGERFSRVRLPIAPETEQERIVSVLRRVEVEVDALASHCIGLRNTVQTLREHLLGGES